MAQQVVADAKTLESQAEKEWGAIFIKHLERRIIL
jgi:hypothetical protein